jgi:hypothetical protein
MVQIKGMEKDSWWASRCWVCIGIVERAADQWERDVASDVASGVRDGVQGCEFDVTRLGHARDKTRWHRIGRSSTTGRGLVEVDVCGRFSPRSSVSSPVAQLLEPHLT